MTRLTVSVDGPASPSVERTRARWCGYVLILSVSESLRSAGASARPRSGRAQLCATIEFCAVAPRVIATPNAPMSGVEVRSTETSAPLAG